MSITKRIAFGATASWFSRGVTILLGLVLMPVLFRHLPREELGVWMLLGQTWSVMSILDLGLSFTLTRRIALAKGKSGGDPNVPLTEETRHDIADLVESGRRIYHWLAVVTFIVSSGAGFFYLRQLHFATLSLPMAMVAWEILCLSQSFGLWAQVWNCLLSGVGYVGWDAVLSAIISTLTLVSQIAALFLGGGLIALATMAAVGAVAQRYLLLGFARNRRPELFKIRGHWNAPVIRSMISPSLHAWVTGIGLVIVLNTDQFFIASLKGVAQIPAYRAAYLVLFNITMMAAMGGLVSAVFVSHLWQSGEVEEVHRLLIRNLRFGLGIMAAGGACVLVLGHRLFDVWLGPGNFIGYPILCIFFIIQFFETQCSIITSSSRATEDEAFAVFALVAAILKLVLAAVLGIRFGLLGIASSTLIAQLATNHWYMVVRGLARLQISFKKYFLNVLLPVVALFFLVAFVVWLAIAGLIVQTGWASLMSAAVVAAIIFGVFIWFVVLEPGHRPDC